MRLSSSQKLNFFCNAIAFVAAITYGCGIALKHGFWVAGPMLFAEGFSLAVCAIHPDRKAKP